jgi:XTP/dITP diphosphohydrolase
VKLVLASNNPGKLREMRALLAPLGHAVLAQAELGIDEAEEPYDSFLENALAKARLASRASGLPALADDSGLCVDALGGSPGVLSARYATLFGRAKSDDENNRVLLEQLASHADRRGRFVSALVAVRSADDPEPLIAFGRWEGEVLREPRGAGGFGYDPLLFIPALGQSVAELSAQAKNTHSHRAIASQQMLALMREVWRLG